MYVYVMCPCKMFVHVCVYERKCLFDVRYMCVYVRVSRECVWVGTYMRLQILPGGAASA